MTDREAFEACPDLQDYCDFSRCPDGTQRGIVVYNDPWTQGAWQGWQAALASERAKQAEPKFAHVYCSQCGGEFGPGNHGYSDCKDHAAQVDPVAFGHDGKPWPHTIDAKAWADEFCKRNTATDHGAMIGWFANAIEFARAHDAAPPTVQGEQILRSERDAARAQRDKTMQILVGIHRLLYPPRVEHDGKTFVFQQDDANDWMQRVSDAIRAIPEQIAEAAPPAVQAEPVAIPSFIRRPIESAIEAAHNPPPGSMVVGMPKALVATDKLAYLLRMFDQGLYAAPPADDEAVRLLRKARYMCDDSDTFTRMALAKAIDAYLAKAEK